MARMWWVLLWAAIGLGCRQKSAVDLDTEIAKAAKMQGAEASLRYLLALPTQNTTAEARYKRLREIARLEGFLKRLTDADGHLRECITVSESAQKPRFAGNCSADRFNVLLELEQFEGAEKALEEARKYAAEAHDTSLEAYLIYDHGYLLEKRGHFEEAVGPIQKALQQMLARHELARAALMRISLAWAFWEMGRYDQASEQYVAFQKEAYAGDQHLGEGNLGNLRYQQRDFAGAIKFYQHAAQMAKDSDQDYYATWLLNEATAWIELGDLGKAEDRNRLALSVGNKLPKMTQRPHALVNQARIAAGQGQTAPAIQQLRVLVGEPKDLGAALDACSELVRIYLQLGDSGAASAAYQAGLEVANKKKAGFSDLENQLSFTASVMNLNQQYVAGLMNRGRLEEAFETAEASRAGMLRGSFNLGQQGRLLPVYRNGAKRSSTAYFAYWLAPERSYLWVITGDGFRSYSLPDEQELRERIDRFQKLVQERGDARKEGAQLFEALVAPARKQLGKIATVVIVPDGALYSMNFETLRQGGRYWLEDVTISITPSLSLMLGKSGPVAVNRRMLLLGDATEWNPDFPQLMNSPGELDRIAEQFPDAERTRLTKAQATPAEYERQDLESYRYIHFATHAAANRSAPLESAIILSQANGRGSLTARDVMAKQVGAELISISACKSAGSRTYAGEGLVGLAWAFLHSGAHSVVAGLWDVSDYSSPLIMGAMYGGLAKGVNAPEALRAAKLELLKPGSKYADPYYWGPFLLYRGAGAR